MLVGGRKLRDRRDKLGYTLADIELYLGLSTCTISKLEHDVGKFYNFNKYEQLLDRLELLEQLISQYPSHAANCIAKLLTQHAECLNLQDGTSEGKYAA